jgi:hypothetical protein
MPSTSGTVIPNHQLGNLGGSGGDHHVWNIDARGSTDPAQTQAQINRSLRIAGPQIAAAAKKSTQDAPKRRPAASK